MKLTNQEENIIVEAIKTYGRAIAYFSIMVTSVAFCLFILILSEFESNIPVDEAIYFLLLIYIVIGGLLSFKYKNKFVKLVKENFK